ALRYAPGTRATCYVNPSNPDEAVLERPLPTVLFMLPLPLLFIAIGVGAVWFTWRPSKSQTEEAAAPISSGAKRPGRGARVGVAFFAIFLVVGLSVTFVMGR